MIWLIENFVGDNGYESLIEEVRNQGHECIVLDITNHFELKHKPENECVLFQGSIQLCKKLRAELKGCSPVAFCNFEKFLCSNYYPYLGQFLFNDRYKFASAKTLEDNKWEFFAQFGCQATIFVRPNSGEKIFKAGLIRLEDFDKEWQKNYDYGMINNDIVVVSSPKKIRGEWRFVCSDTPEILGVSCYKYQDQYIKIPSAPTGARNLVDKILKVGYYPDRLFCVDIVEDNDGNFWLMELNSFSSAGLYACDKKRIVEEASRIAKEEYEKI